MKNPHAPASPSLDRRDFLKRSALFGSTLILTSTLRGQGADRLARPRVACIGCGAIAKRNLRAISQVADVVALCDADFEHAAEYFQSFPKARKYRDFRRLFEKERSEIDGVMVSTADHAHYPAALWAMDQGKHLFVEKPMAPFIRQIRDMRTRAEAKGLITQMGNQFTHNEHMLTGREYLEAGAIGAVHTVYVWSSNRPFWPQGFAGWPDAARVPDHLDWDAWQAAQPERPFSPEIHPRRWRGFLMYGSGSLGDMGCHLLEFPLYALRAGWPDAVSAETTGVTDVSYPSSMTITYTFAAKGDRPAFKLVWLDGGQMPPRPSDLSEGRELPEQGVLYHGDGGTMMMPFPPSRPQILPLTKMKNFLRERRPEKQYPRPADPIWQEWGRAIADDGTTRSNFAYAAPLTEVVMLGNLAARTGKEIHWDPERMVAEGVPVAQDYLDQAAYREGWTL